MNDLERLGFKFCGFWDRCFFTAPSKESGIIVEDKDGNKRCLSWFEIKKIIGND